LAKEDQINKLRTSIEVIDKITEVTKLKTTKNGTKKVSQQGINSVDIAK
jgi:hypothetical protein